MPRLLCCSSLRTPLENPAGCGALFWCSSRRRRDSSSCSSELAPQPSACSADLALALADEALARGDGLAARHELVAGSLEGLLRGAQLLEARGDLGDTRGILLLLRRRQLGSCGRRLAERRDLGGELPLALGRRGEEERERALSTLELGEPPLLGEDVLIGVLVGAAPRRAVAEASASSRAATARSRSSSARRRASSSGFPVSASGWKGRARLGGSKTGSRALLR